MLLALVMQQLLSADSARVSRLGAARATGRLSRPTALVRATLSLASADWLALDSRPQEARAADLRAARATSGRHAAGGGEEGQVVVAL